MKKIILIAVWCMGILYAYEGSSMKVMKLSQKGEKIVHTLCEKEKLPSASGSIKEVMEKIKASKSCPPLSQSKLEAVAYYVSNGSMATMQERMHVPNDAKCPVCGMFVSKYPKWAAFMERDGKKYFFDGVKDMMKYYIFDGDFVYDRKQISKMTVSDYYTLEEIPAKEAFYVLDSDVFGPMGHELIPFKDEESAKTFKTEHNGKAIVQFDEISDRMLMSLDGM